MRFDLTIDAGRRVRDFNTEMFVNLFHDHRWHSMST